MVYLTFSQRRQLAKLTKNKSSEARRRITKQFESQIIKKRSKRDTSGGNVTYGRGSSTRVSRSPGRERAQVEFAKEARSQQQENIKRQKEYKKEVERIETQKPSLGVGESIRQREKADIKAGVGGYEVAGKTYKRYGQAVAAAERERQSVELRKRVEQRKPVFTGRDSQGFTKAGSEWQREVERYNTKIVVGGKKTKIGRLEQAGLVVSETPEGYQVDPKGYPTTLEGLGFDRPGLFLEDLARASYADLRSVETEARIKLAQAKTDTERKRILDWKERKISEITPTLQKAITRPVSVKFEKGASKYSKDPLTEVLTRAKNLDIPWVDVDLTPSGRVGLVGAGLGLSAIAAPSALLTKAPIKAAASQSVKSVAGFAAAGEIGKVTYKATGSEALALGASVVGGSAISMGPTALYRASPIKIQTAKLPGQKVGAITFRGKPLVTGVVVDKTIGKFKGQFKGVVPGSKQTGVGAYRVTELGRVVKEGVGRIKLGPGTTPVQPLALPKGGTLPYTTTMAQTVGQSKFTTSLLSAAIKKQPKFIPSEVSYYTAGLRAGRALQKAPSPRVTVPDFTQVKVLQRPGLQYIRKPYIKLLESQKSQILLKGSLSDLAQASPKVLPKFSKVPVKDIDIATVGYSPERFAQIAMKKLPKGKARVKGQKLELYDVKERKFVEVSDIVSKEEVGVGYGGGEARLGLVTQQKPIKYKGFVMQRMSEQVGRRLSTMLEVQRGPQGYYFSPIKQGRVFKDTYRFMEINTPSLVEGLRKSKNPFNWMKARTAEKAVSKMKEARGLDITTPQGFGKSLFFTEQKALTKTRGVPKSVLPKISKRKGLIKARGKEGRIIKPKSKKEEFIYGTEEAYYKLYPKRKKSGVVYPYSPLIKSTKKYPTAYPKTEGYSKVAKVYPKTKKSKSYPISVTSKSYPVVKPTAYMAPTGSYTKAPTTQTYPVGSTPTTYPVAKKGSGIPTAPVITSPPTVKADIPKKGIPSVAPIPDIKKKKKQGYDVFVKRTQAKKGKGKYKSRGFVKANVESLPQEGAFVLGAELVDKYANRSFTIRKSKKATTTPGPQVNRVKYYREKVRTKKGNKNVFVEKTKHAIDSTEEKLKIPYESVRLRKLGVIPYPKRRRL